MRTLGRCLQEVKLSLGSSKPVSDDCTKGTIESAQARRWSLRDSSEICIQSGVLGSDPKASDPFSLSPTLRRGNRM